MMATFTATIGTDTGAVCRPVENGGHVVGEMKCGLADVDTRGRVGGVVGCHHRDKVGVV